MTGAVQTRRAPLGKRLGLRASVVAPALATVAAVVALFVLLLAVAGASPAETVRGIVEGSVGSTNVLAETLIRFAPLVLIAAALVPSLRAGLFNIGAPGQIAMGGFAAGMVSLHLDALPRAPLLAAAAAAAAAAGIAWGLVPALLRAYLGVNEILATLVFNFLAAGLLSYLLGGPLQGEMANIPQSDPLPEKTALPVLIPDTRAHVGIILGLLAIVALALYSGTRSGYRLRLYSASPPLARQAGAAEARLVVWSMCLGAGGAGLAGWMVVAGVDRVIYANVAAPIGYTGLFVALLGGMHPGGILVAGFFLAALLQGGNAAQLTAGVSPEIIQALIGMILLGVAVVAAQRRRSAGAGAP